MLLGLDVFSAAYLADIIIFSDTWQEHLSRLRTVLSRIRAANLTLSPSKCCFAVVKSTIWASRGSGPCAAAN